MQPTYSPQEEILTKHSRYSWPWSWIVFLCVWFFLGGMWVHMSATTPRELPCTVFASFDHLEATDTSTTWYGLDKQGHACVNMGKGWVNTGK